MRNLPKVIPKKDLEHGAYYHGTCRNASEARWDANHNLFLHYRTKFNHIFLEEIRHPEDENYYDVFYPLEKLDKPTKEIIFYEAVPSAKQDMDQTG